MCLEPCQTSMFDFFCVKIVKGLTVHCFRSSHQKCSVKKVFLEILQNSQESTCKGTAYFIKKETQAQFFSCEFCEIFENTILQNTSRGCLEAFKGL